MPGGKTNEREGTRAVLRHSRMSATKVRQVLDLIRGQDVDRAAETLTLGDRDAATTVGKVLASAVANAVHNDGLDAEELYVSACYADEGTTAKRWRPRARGRATRIRKRSSHITIIVSRLPADKLELRRKRMEAVSANRSRRVDASRRRADLSGRLSRRRASQAVAQAEAAAAAEAEADEDLITDDVIDVDEVEVEENETDEFVDDVDDVNDEDEVEDDDVDDVTGAVEDDDVDNEDDTVTAEADTEEKGE